MVLRCTSFDYSILKDNQTQSEIYPFFRDKSGQERMWRVSPLHGRSFVVGRHSDGRYVVSKGNGLGYTEYPLLNTGEMGADTWGLLLRKDAERDFVLGNEVAETDILTNRMEYVLELDMDIVLEGMTIRPALLQYSVSCPYRINDAPFISKKVISDAVSRWGRFDIHGLKEPYLIASDVLIGNLRTLHDRGILHNAIHEGNYTWDLELLDFELSCSPTTPYDREDYRRHVPDLFSREVLQTYGVINYIAGVLDIYPDYGRIDTLFRDYGFDIGKYSISLLKP